MAKYKFIHKVEVVIDGRTFREGEELYFIYKGKPVTGKIMTIDDRHDLLYVRVDEIDYPVKPFKVALIEEASYVYYD